MEAGHQVQIPAEVDPPLVGAKDHIHFAHIQRSGQAILTYNPGDFEALHIADNRHGGVLAVYRDNDPTRDMDYHDMVRAIRNLEAINVPIAGGFWILNGYQW